MGVTRRVRLAIEHAQDVLSGELGQEWEYNFMLSFLGDPVCVQPFVPFFYWFFPFFVLVVFFSQKSNRFVWVCLSTFWCLVLSCSDLRVVFKRIIYPVLS